MYVMKIIPSQVEDEAYSNTIAMGVKFLVMVCWLLLGSAVGFCIAPPSAKQTIANRLLLMPGKHVFENN